MNQKYTTCRFCGLYRSLLALCLLCFVPMTQTAVAQSFEDHAKAMSERFEAFKKQTQQSYAVFSAKQNEEFAAFVEQQWQLFDDCRRQAVPQSAPKPDIQPVAVDTTSVMADTTPAKNDAKSVPTDIQTATAPVESENMACPPAQSADVAPTDAYALRTSLSASGTKEVAVPKARYEEGNVSLNQLNIKFYGQDIALPCSPKLRLHAAGTKEADCAAWFRSFARLDTEADALWQALDQQAIAFGLNDWGHFCLSRSVAETLFTDINDRVLFTFCLLRNMGGYKVKLARGCDSGNLTLLLALDNTKDVFSYSYFTMKEDGRAVRYYAVYGGGKPKESVYTYTFQEQDNSLHEMGLDFAQALTIGSCDTSRTLRAEKYNIRLKLPYNTANLAYLDNVPMTVFPVYFRTPVSPEALRVLQLWMLALNENRTQTEIVAILLNFVQTAFQYKTDENQFGYEKYFYPEEVIGYPYSDCEDRSALFAWLVTTFTDAWVIGLQYEGHIATAVSFDDDTALHGDAFSYAGRKYYVCDPTFYNASIGMTMPQYKGVTPKLIKLKK